jgi:hypothetical protein
LILVFFNQSNIKDLIRLFAIKPDPTIISGMLLADLKIIPRLDVIQNHVRQGAKRTGSRIVF